MRCAYHDRPHRDDAGRVHGVMTEIIVFLGVRKPNRLSDAQILVEVTHIARQIGIISIPAQVAFKVPDIDGIELAECREKLPISLGQMRTHENASR
jgi:hypothetical protein